MKRRTRSLPTISLALLLTAVAACSKSDKPEVSAATPQPSASASQSSPSSPAARKAAGDGAFACTLLTREETQAVQGEPFKETKASQKLTAGLIQSQCYFELPTTVNSIVLTVTQRAEGADARDPKQNWQELFHRDKALEKKKKRRKAGKGRRRSKVWGMKPSGRDRASAERCMC